MVSPQISRSAGQIPGFAFVLGLLWTVSGQAGHLISGPMLGYVEHREALIWLEVEDSTTVVLTCWPEERPEERKFLEMPHPRPTPPGDRSSSSDPLCSSQGRPTATPSRSTEWTPPLPRDPSIPDPIAVGVAHGRS